MKEKNVNNQRMLDFLMEHDIILLHEDTGNRMIADQAEVFGGEFVVYDDSPMSKDLYRGLDFDNAVYVMEGKNE
jgi:hypothetical protein